MGLLWEGSPLGGGLGRTMGMLGCGAEGTAGLGGRRDR